MGFNPAEYSVEPLEYELQEGESGPYMQPFQALPPGYGYEQQQPVQRQQYVYNNREMAQVESRLAKAQYYRALMEGQLFDQADAMAFEVEREIKDFIVSRMKALVGEEVEASKPVFTAEEVAILKQWAATLKARATQPVATAPVVRPAAVPTAQPAVAPVAPQAAPAAPSVRRKKAPSMAPAPTPGSTAQRQQAAPKPPSRRPVRGGAPKPNAPLRPGEVPAQQPIPVPQGAAMEMVMQQKAAQEAAMQQAIETNDDPNTMVRNRR